jgi:hypothetical protein
LAKIRGRGLIVVEACGIEDNPNPIECQEVIPDTTEDRESICDPSRRQGRSLYKKSNNFDKDLTRSMALDELAELAKQ